MACPLSCNQPLNSHKSSVCLGEREREKKRQEKREREREREKGEAASFCSYLSPRMPTTLHHDSRRAQPKRGEAFVGFSKKTSSFHRADAIQRSTHCASSENVPCGCFSGGVVQIRSSGI